jgi:hypothetical protein
VYGVGGAIAIVRLRWSASRGPPAIDLPLSYLVGCGLLFVTYTVLLFLAIGLARGRQQVLEVGLLNYLWPALTILLSVVLLNKRARLLLYRDVAALLQHPVLTHGAHISGRHSAERAETPRLFASLGRQSGLRSVLPGDGRRWCKGPCLFRATGCVLLLACLLRMRAWSASSLAEAAS